MPILSRPITHATPLTDLIAYAKSEIDNLLKGEKFLIKDLFLGYEWERIDKGNRKRLGGAFKVFVEGEGGALIEYLDKTAQNQHKYKKI